MFTVDALLSCYVGYTLLSYAAIMSRLLFLISNKKISVIRPEYFRVGGQYLRSREGGGGVEGHWSVVKLVS